MLQDTSGHPRRWDTDQGAIGTTEARVAVAPLLRLLEACLRPGWVTEDPGTYVGLALRHQCETLECPWRWVGEAQDGDGVYVVDVEHVPASDHQLWEDAICLLSAVAEDSFHVRRVDRRTVECVTGMLDGDGEFASHGHAIRLRIDLREVGADSPWPRASSQGDPLRLQRCGAALHNGPS
ncbi:MAG: hypothetical protein JWL57_884 [Actinobacteria bacterium]|nr:hypothetical protein [Actinomycetota bacterium]